MLKYQFLLRNYKTVELNLLRNYKTVELNLLRNYKTVELNLLRNYKTVELKLYIKDHCTINKCHDIAEILLKLA